MREETYDISGMHCAACSASVERVTRKLPGVERSDVNLTTEKMTIRYDETKVTPEQIVAKVEKAGFGCTPHAEKKEAAEQALQDAEASEGEHSNLGTVGFAVGFVLMMVLDVALG